MRKLTLENIEAEERVDEYAKYSSDLSRVVDEYAQNKLELDSYKKICDVQNSQIKKMLGTTGVHHTDKYVAKTSVSTKDVWDEAKLLSILLKECVAATKVVQVIDWDELERMLYNDEISPEVAAQLSACKTTKEIVTLRVTKRKK